jgi:large subunit ribosomal protein L25
MREIPLAATLRTGTGKGVARQARMAGKIPGVVYGPETTPTPVSVDEHAFRMAMKSATRSSILNLQVDGKESKVLVREIQRHPVTSKVTHIDFHAISMTKPIHVSIPINFVGTPVGVKVDGGIMQATMREIEISCLPVDIPEHFEVDVSELGIGDAIHVGTLQIPKATILGSSDRTVVVISAPTIIKAAVAEVPAEGEAAVVPAEGEGAATEEAEKGEKGEKKDKKEE